MPIVNIANNEFTTFLAFWDGFIPDIPKLKTAEETFYAALLGMEANYPKQYQYFKANYEANKKALLVSMSKLFQIQFKFKTPLKVNSLNSLPKTTSTIRFDSTYRTEGPTLVKYLSQVLPEAAVTAEDTKGMAYTVHLQNPAPVNAEWIKALNSRLYKLYPELDGLAGFNYF